MPQPASLPLLPRLRLASLVLTVLLTVSPAGAAEAGPAEAAVPKLKAPIATKQVAPEHPPELKKKLINGRAIIECLITETGSLQELKVISATEPEFGQAAEAAIRQWEFLPGERGGQTVPVRLQIPFEFRLTAEQVIEAAADRQVFQEVTDLVIPAKELPSWPRPVTYLLPRYPESLKGSGKYGKAVVSIIINKEGKVLNPRIVKSSYPEFSMPALVTAAKLEFPPQVMANNERIHVSMDLQFDFKADVAKPKAKQKPAKK